jgi:hypothetical protein
MNYVDKATMSNKETEAQVIQDWNSCYRFVSKGAVTIGISIMKTDHKYAMNCN